MADAVDAVIEQWGRERPDIDFWPVGIVGRLMRISRMWDKEIKDFLAGHDLEPGEFDVLSTLRRSGAPYELTAGAFLKTSLVTTGAITLRVDRMQGKGLVVRTRAEGDRRSVKIRLTDHGLDVIDRVLPLHIANEARLLRALGPQERAQLAAGMSAMLESYGDTPASSRPD
ncbi:MarR family transcriptional regulator [Streptomyces spectabilis]|uniref:MarR family transcriptional regulator n=1 Tax=Streptomyces spectabilis TaxID=68270 RepID=A0A5P2X4Z2_STRST|nr:MarR family transcriptional regulator [Streptomyces spectabilis]MBB5107290.1 DNA-binding MarR family transcriptional regulator [Streptomyces spectabilis]MCI3899991.1 MarR family transcriptional regulator [Streptomyces spectabilis]QEV57626.1 MarR family transcriptional regulator [Streptomyces spectabilis]GGV36676.1 MarR family transcriptional regulator [Streptomyces spectabilis]